ncbi:RNA 2',3'-cyclic phosphodiesterase [Candidatus Clostridium stratigraminis]|uniref:RNA 2',3'-cyclic phosphodiesterase n=1 Tax=Candidatus Clostridium stratigraminis TaxID=3381661 RepID=A0ABW8T132_9CLOT
MRLFIAIDFDKNIKAYLENIEAELKNYCNKGSFTSIDNFHITLAFLGELEESTVSGVIKAMENSASKFTPFLLTFDKIGNFNKGNSNILWMGTSYSEKLTSLHKKLCINLKKEGIDYDEKPLKPHITIGRQVILNKEIIEIANSLNLDHQMKILINSITLMESKRINRKLTYVPLAEVSLKY